MKKNQPPVDDLPQEVKEYYKSERRQKTGVAWLLALGTLLLTLGVAAALFFGGTWLWNTLTNKDEQPADTAQTQSESTEQQPAAEEQQSTEDSTAAITGSDYSTAGSADQSASTSSDQATSSATTGATTTATDIPAAGDSTPEPDALVNTGPGDENY